MLGKVQEVAGAVGVAGIHGLLGLGDVIAHVAAGGDHVSAKAEAIALHLLLESAEAALNRCDAAVKMVDLCLHRVKLALSFESLLLLGLDVFGRRRSEEHTSE